MACQNESTVITEPVEVSWGREQVVCVTPVFPVVESSYMEISDQTTEYYIWQNDGAGVDPAPAGRTGIEIDTSAATTAAEVASAWVTALELDGTFYANISDDGLSLSIRTKDIGEVVSAAADVDTTATIETDAIGIGGDLGKTEAEVTLNFSIEKLAMTSNQTGTIPLDQFINGGEATIEMRLAEMTKERWSLVMGEGVGENYTPSSGTEMSGFGTASINKSMFNNGGKLILHPLNRATKDRDITFFKTLPEMGSVNFDSQAQQGADVTFVALPDDFIQSTINLFAFGDSTQDLRA